MSCGSWSLIPVPPEGAPNCPSSTILMIPLASEESIYSQDPLFFESRQVVSIVIIAALQSVITLSLHCAELIVNLSRDEEVFRRVTSSKGAHPKYNSILMTLKSWQSIVLLMCKAISHWMFSLALSSYLRLPILVMYPMQISYLSIPSGIVAAFATYVSLRRPSGPLPATYGHLKRLVDLIDECQGDSLMLWGHKVDDSNGEPNLAGMENEPMRVIKMDELYG